jgi:hypothetical protein
VVALQHDSGVEEGLRWPATVWGGHGWPRGVAVDACGERGCRWMHVTLLMRESRGQARGPTDGGGPQQQYRAAI